MDFVLGWYIFIMLLVAENTKEKTLARSGRKVWNDKEKATTGQGKGLAS